VKSRITIDVQLDNDKVPEKIEWNAEASTADEAQNAKAVMLALWDGEDKSALRIDLWTKDMMVDEMADFYYQTFIGMADTFSRATHQEELVNEMKAYAKNFYNKFKDAQLANNK
jgi:gliding motility-associated protein GldC